ncbi:MAG: hypothetical protein ACSHX8_00045 [Opitutaceae bacterium]
MKSFEEFVASREKMDPSAQKMSEHQWQQAYTAYCSSRKRLRKSSSTKRPGGQGDSSRQPSSRSGGKHQTPSVSVVSALRVEVRGQTAYPDLRLIVDILAWVAIGVIIVKALVVMSMGMGGYGVFSSLLDGALGVVIVFALKLLAQAVIDIPDIALQQHVQTNASELSDDSNDS